MKIDLSIKKIAKNISYFELKDLIYEFNKINNKKEAETENMFDNFKIHLKEQPDREIIYSNDFVESLIELYEKNTIPKNSFLDYSEKAGFIKDNKRTDDFMEIMNYTHDTYGYDFGYIQDQAWYKIYPKYL